MIVSNASVALALVQNVMMFVDSTVILEMYGANVPDAWAEAYGVALVAFGSIQVFTCSLAALVTFVRSTLLQVLTRWYNVKGLRCVRRCTPSAGPRPTLASSSNSSHS